MNIRALVTDFLIWGLLIFFLVAGFVNLDSVRQFSSVSLRFDTPVSGRDAYSARLYSVSHSGDDTFWPTFWTEYTASFLCKFASVDASCIAYSGDASLVWPAKLIDGTMPGIVDGGGCVVSTALAWRLWGGVDVIGMNVEIDGAKRVVRGVFKSDMELALISFRDEDTTRGWSAVELSGGAKNFGREDAERYASAAGLGKPVSILMNGSTVLAGVMSALPPIIITVYGFIRIITDIRKRFPVARKVAIYIILTIFAVLLPTILGAAPTWLIPTRWSDFSFWGSLLRQAAIGIREFLSVSPRLRDVELKVLLLKQAGILFPAVCLSLAVCFRRHFSGESNK